MDLSRIETLTREMLEAEARRRGIKSPEFRTRTELVRLILRHRYGGQLDASRERIEQGVSRARVARDLLSTAVNAAIGALPDSLGLLGRLAGKQALPRREAREDQSPEARYEQSAAARYEREREAAYQQSRQAAVADRAQRPSAAAWKAPETAPTREPAHVATHETPTAAREATAETSVPQPIAAEPTSAQPMTAQSGAARTPTTRTFEEEPIRTRSMAQLLAAQGHRERALAIYEELIAKPSTSNETIFELEREATAVRRGEAVAAMVLPIPREPRYAGPNPHVAWLPENALPQAQLERLECEGTPHTGLLLRWTITDEGTRRACAVLGVNEADAELTLRLVAIRPDANKVVRSEITEHGPVKASGEWLANPLDDVARCVASIGLRAGGRFVSIAHARA